MKPPMRLLTAAILTVFCARADAAYSAPELIARPELPAYPSPFYCAPPESTPPLSAPLMSAPLPGGAGQPTAPASPVPAAAMAREHFGPALEALHARSPLTQPQRAAVAAVAKSAVESRDVDTLAQLGLLATGENGRDPRDLLVEALRILRGRLQTRESEEAAGALRLLGERRPIPEKTRAWMAEQVKARVAQKHLSSP